MRNKLNAGLAAGVILVISYYSLKPGSAVNPSTGSMFPILHLLAYFGLAGAFLLNLNDRNRNYIIAIFSAFTFGLLMELMQTQITGRFFTYQDLVINLVGASIILTDSKLGLADYFIQLEGRFIEKIDNWQSI